MSYLKEACVETFEQIEQAAKAKIDRIELCDRLDLGGTTPKLKKIKFALNLFIPIVVMIRVNNTFYVSRWEFYRMRYQIRRLRKYPIEGFVFGLLTHDDKIDYARINLLVKTCKSKQKVFHMAFDEVNNKLEAIDKLASIGINRILTKGGSGTAENNLRQLYELNEYARGKLVIVAGGKVNDDNYLKIANSTGINQFHGRNLGMK